MRKVFPWIFIILMFASAALGGEAPAPEAPEAGGGSAGMAALYEIIIIVAGVIGSVLTTILVLLAKKYGKKIGIEIDGETEKFIRKSADSAIRQVEAWAVENKRQNRAVGNSSAKLTKALGILNLALEGSGVKKLAEEKLTAIIEERLFAMKAKGQMGNPT